MKQLLSTLLLVVCVHTFGQGLNIKGGLNLGKLLSKIDGDKDDFFEEDQKLLPGVHAGLTYQIMVKKGFYIEPGALYSLKGAKAMVKEDGDYDKLMIRLHYIEIPVNFGYKHTFEKKNISIYTFFGPYFGFAAGGKYVSKVKFDGEKDKNSEKVNFGSEGLSRFDAGLNIGAGMEFKKIILGLQYGIGLANMLGKDNRGTDDYKLKLMSRTLGLTIGYRFGKNKED